jgi:hypothetical protein
LCLSGSFLPVRSANEFERVHWIRLPSQHQSQ